MANSWRARRRLTLMVTAQCTRRSVVPKVQHLGLRWLLGFTSMYPLFLGVRIKADALRALASVCQRQLGALGSKQTAEPRRVTSPVPPDDVQPDVELHHRVCRLVGRFYTGVAVGPHGSLKKDILVYLKCRQAIFHTSLPCQRGDNLTDRGSADAIRLILNDQAIPYMEFHVGRSITSERFRNEFMRAKLPDNLPYYSDGFCEMAGAGTVLRYIAEKTNLMGVSPADKVKIQSIVEYGFSVLHSLWKADCQCGETERLSEDRAKAKFVKNKLFPILRSLNSLVPVYDEHSALTPAALVDEDSALSLTPRPQKKWIAGFVRSSKLHAQNFLSFFFSSLLLISSEFGSSILLPFVNITKHSQAVEYYRPNIRAFSESPHRY
ncbi:hypothetical protein BESB_068030 [Besnoitia besnoiti]|uniref:GST N-terminal domain-containing protein n=1 Tax=Besnoitia besnoiti TaxID=94643 RepID=A0A2A9MH73_BESBE|nr:hypothetical protein BESB_068030 [Besnoitia besnoiti]PFH34770.1 hypothetical protein BESB_068030 [Besnoitia besnoiti]